MHMHHMHTAHTPSFHTSHIHQHSTHIARLRITFRLAGTLLPKAQPAFEDRSLAFWLLFLTFLNQGCCFRVCGKLLAWLLNLGHLNCLFNDSVVTRPLWAFIFLMLIREEMGLKARKGKREEVSPALSLW